jgi:virulence factor Mce-like protein
MIKQAPKLSHIVLMVGFTLASFVVLLYLWLSFGGTVPLQAEGYRFHVQFPEATQLAEQADVRIAGVPVGKVVAREAGHDNRTDVTIELRSRYAPIPRDARAMLRAKTLLGETFVDLTPGNRSSGMLPDGGTLPDSAVAPTVELDEIFRTFDEPTRQAFQTWMQSQSAASAGRGADINAAFANLPEFVAVTDDLMRELNAQSGAVSETIASTGDFFDAISERDGQLRGLITESERLFRVTAERNRQFAAIWRELPRFERESRLTLPRLTRFADVATPVVKELQPAATEMAPTFAALARQGHEFRGFFRNLGPVITASKRGVPALERTMAQLPPLLEDFQPFLRNFNPMVAYLGLNEREITSFAANLTATTNGRDLPEVLGGRAKDPVNFLRVAAPLGPESLAFYPRPLGNSRANAYAVPDWLERLATGLPVYDGRHCSNGEPAPPAAADPPELRGLIQQFVFRTPGRDVARPGCVEQGAYPGYGTSFPQLRAEP